MPPMMVEDVHNRRKTSQLYNRMISSVQITKVMLYSCHRCGSTFVGDLFKQNPNIFYMFEPLFFFNRAYNSSFEPVMLLELYQCNFHSNPYFDYNRYQEWRCVFYDYCNYSLYELSNICLSHSVRVIKTIRLENIKKAVDIFKDVKIIHLVSSLWHSVCQPAKTKDQRYGRHPLVI